MKFKYEFEIDTPYENNCRACPLLGDDDGFFYCIPQNAMDDIVKGFDAEADYTEKQLFEKYSEMEMGCPLEVVR